MSYVYDTLDSAMHTFSEKQRKRINRHLEFLASDFTKQIHVYQIYYKQSYMDFIENCKTMEVFAGRQNMLASFFQGQPHCKKLLEEWLEQFIESGVGKEDILRPWLEEFFFRLFSSLLEIHAQHTRSEAVLHLDSPATALFKDKKETPVDFVLDLESHSSEDLDHEDIYR